jgi:NADH dehydrogenase
LIGGGGTKFQPVFAGDVAAAVALAVDGGARAGATYELGGPEVATFRAILEFILATIGRKRWLVPIPFETAEVLGTMSEFGLKLSLGLLPETFVITRDQVALLKSDNIVSEEAIAEGRTLPGLGISPEAYEAFVPTYLYRYRKTGQFSDPRAIL